MLAKASFLALMVMPSAAANTSRTMSVTGRAAWPGSRHLMNHAFSAKRQASMKSGLPWRCATSATARTFSRLTGWPPPALLVSVSITSGTRSAERDSRSSSRATSMLPLKGCRLDGSWASAMTKSTASAPVASMLPRVVSKCVFDGTILPAPPTIENRIASAARPWCVGMMWRYGINSRTAVSNR